MFRLQLTYENFLQLIAVSEEVIHRLYATMTCVISRGAHNRLDGCQTHVNPNQESVRQ
jgi:hypothetical protein